MYNLLIVEDEEIQRKALCKIIKQLGKQIFVYEACDFNGAIQLCTTKHFDIIFLDLKLEDTINSSKNGLDIAIYLRSLKEYEYTPIVFITSIPDYIQRALNQTMCFQYILKPYTPESITNCLTKLLHSPLLPLPKFSFHNYYGGKMEFFQQDIIRFTPSASHRIYIYTTQGRFESGDYTLDQIEELISEHFLRCHRKHLINPAYIVSYLRSKQKITLIEDVTIPVGRSYKSYIDKKMEDLL